MAYMEGEQYVPLLRQSYQMWREIESATDTTLLTTTGVLMIGNVESQLVSGARHAAVVHHLVHEMLSADQIRRRYPMFTPADHDVALYEEVAGLFRAEAAITAFQELAVAAGAKLRTGVAVLGWTVDGSGVRVRTDDGDLLADRLVLAPGAWAGGLLDLAVPLRVQRRVQHYWHPSPAAEFQIGRCPVWLWESMPGEIGYGLPVVDGQVKAGMHTGDDPTDPDTGASPAHPDEVAALRCWLASRVPGLAAGVWSGAKPCLYTLTPDEHFVIGRHPAYPSVVIAAGFSGHGFKFAPVVGTLLAELVDAPTTSWDIELFDPTRFTREPETGPENGSGADRVRGAERP
jgi:sarcosine oxidase